MKNTYQKYAFKSKSIGDFEFFIDEETFTPTQTTTSIINSSLTMINNEDKILDLGCGCGIVGIIIANLNNKNFKLFASDISSNAGDGMTKKGHTNNKNNNEIHVDSRIRNFNYCALLKKSQLTTTSTLATGF